ncbi:MAG: HDOD domain-containing protein [Chitinivibrionales bacterium]|nr:HDOD domain-containing protein [Chitinivibrionales bacterium]
MTQTEVLRVLDKVENLPTLPVVAGQILKLVENKMSSMVQIAAVIARDQAIAARVIRLVNSAFYALRTRVSSIQHAIAILGLNTVKNLVLGISVVKAFQDNARTSIFDREQFWVHTFATALGAKLIAVQTKQVDPEDCFLAALLHDIGILTTDQFLHDEFIAILERMVDQKSDFLETERSVLGTDHGTIGAHLGLRWRIPEFLVDVMRFHHTPSVLPRSAEQSRRIIEIVHIADAETRKAGIGRFVENLTAEIDMQAYKHAGIESAALRAIIAQVEHEAFGMIKEWGV